MDELFAQATGWLGWAPAVALTTPIPQILIALDAKVEWVQMTNPFGGKPKPKPVDDPDALMAFMRGRA